MRRCRPSWTALREAESRCTSPSCTQRDQRGQLAHPKRPISARQPGCRDAPAGAAHRSSGPSCASIAVYHRERDLDPLAGILGQRQTLQEVASLGRAQPLRSATDAVMEQRGLDPPQPTARAYPSACDAPARASATDARARAGSTPPATAPRRATRAATARPRDRSWPAACYCARRASGRLGQMRHRPGHDQRVAHEQPARARLHRDGESRCWPGAPSTASPPPARHRCAGESPRPSRCPTRRT